MARNFISRTRPHAENRPSDLIGLWHCASRNQNPEPQTPGAEALLLPPAPTPRENTARGLRVGLYGCLMLAFLLFRGACLGACLFYQSDMGFKSWPGVYPVQTWGQPIHSTGFQKLHLEHSPGANPSTTYVCFIAPFFDRGLHLQSLARAGFFK